MLKKQLKNSEMVVMVQNLRPLLQLRNKIGYIAARNFRMLSTALTEYEAFKHDLINKYGEPDKDESGNETGTISIKVGSPNFKAFCDELAPFNEMEHEVELMTAKYEDIQSIQLTQGNHTPGSTDIYTVTMTDGSKYNIAVYNGLNGTGTGDVLGIHFDLVLPASGWSNGSITVAESRLVAAAKYKYLIDAYEASREEYLECNVRPKDISTTGFITFVNDTDPIKDITVNIVRLELSVNAEEGGE